jgi:mannose-6-phosphate isomerase-like protein (cupin superfamily)
MAAWLHNPVTGEVARFNVEPAETGGRRADVDLWLQPGAAVVRAHVHDHLVERYEVLDGELGLLLGKGQRVARPGDGVVEVPVGTVHDWWNAGAGTAHVRVELEAAPAAPGEPAARFVSAIEAMWSLAARGRVNAAGMPDALWLAAIAREYRDVLVFMAPPAAVQRTLFGPLAALARRTGRDPLAPALHGRGAPCAIADPGEDGLAALLAQPVGARAARQHA